MNRVIGGDRMVCILFRCGNWRESTHSTWHLSLAHPLSYCSGVFVNIPTGFLLNVWLNSHNLILEWSIISGRMPCKWRLHYLSKHMPFSVRDAFVYEFLPFETSRNSASGDLKGCSLSLYCRLREIHLRFLSTDSTLVYDFGYFVGRSSSLSQKRSIRFDVWHRPANRRDVYE